MFLANAYYAAGNQELALEELIATRQLLSSMTPLFRSDSVQWLVAQSKSDIEKRVVGPIKKIAADLGPQFRSSPND